MTTLVLKRDSPSNHHHSDCLSHNDNHSLSPRHRGVRYTTLACLHRSNINLEDGHQPTCLTTAHVNQLQSLPNTIFPSCRARRSSHQRGLSIHANLRNPFGISPASLVSRNVLPSSTPTRRTRRHIRSWTRPSCTATPRRGILSHLRTPLIWTRTRCRHPQSRNRDRRDDLLFLTRS